MQYGIYSHDEYGVQIFWSNDTGWGDFADATRFTESERNTFNLPMSNRKSAWFRF
jgi:hypothetical protein